MSPILEYIQVWHAGSFFLAGEMHSQWWWLWGKKTVFFSWKLALFNGVIMLPALDVFSKEINEALLFKHFSLAFSLSHTYTIFLPVIIWSRCSNSFYSVDIIFKILLNHNNNLFRLICSSLLVLSWCFN